MKKNVLIGLAAAALLSVSVSTISVNSSVNKNNVVQAATKTKKLTHNAYVYTSKGKRVKSAKKLSKGEKVKILGYKTIKGKKYARIGKNRYVKAANFTKDVIPKLSVNDTIDKIAKNAKKIKDYSKRMDYIDRALDRPMILIPKNGNGQKLYFTSLTVDMSGDVYTPYYEWGGDIDSEADSDEEFVNLKNYNVSFKVDAGLKQAAKISKKSDKARAKRNTYAYELKKGKLVQVKSIKKGASILDEDENFSDRVYKVNGKYYLGTGEPDDEEDAYLYKVDDITLSK